MLPFPSTSRAVICADRSSILQLTVCYRYPLARRVGPGHFHAGKGVLTNSPNFVSQVDLAILRADLFHPTSKHEAQLSALLGSWHGPGEKAPVVGQDAVGNIIIIKKPATPVGWKPQGRGAAKPTSTWCPVPTPTPSTINYRSHRCLRRW